MLGAGRIHTFYHVTLPLLLPAIVSASLLAFAFSFTSFGVVLILGGPQFATLEVAIYELTAKLFRLPLAGALSMVQLVFTYLFLLLYVLAPEKFVALALFEEGGLATIRGGNKDACGGCAGPLSLFYGFASACLDLCGIGAFMAGVGSGVLPAALAVGYSVTAFGGTLIAGGGMIFGALIAIKERDPLPLIFLFAAAVVLGWAIGVPVAINRDVPAVSIWLLAVDLPLLVALCFSGLGAVDMIHRRDSGNRYDRAYVMTLWFVLGAVKVALAAGLVAAGLWGLRHCSEEQM